MNATKVILSAAAVFALAACEGGTRIDKTVDRGVDGKDLSELVAGIWVDPVGCQHWIIDDGLEGYLSARLDPLGKPVCSDALPTGVAIGNFKGGSAVADTL